MANEPRFDCSAFLKWADSTLKLLIRNPKRGIKASAILIYLLGGMGFFYAVFARLDWGSCDPKIVYLFYVCAVPLYLLIFVFLFSILTKFDKRFA